MTDNSTPTVDDSGSADYNLNNYYYDDEIADEFGNYNRTYDYDDATADDSPFESDDVPLLWTLTILYIVNLLAVFILNAITLVELIKKRNKRIQIVANPYVVCLLLTNVLWPVINIPFNLVQIWTYYWHFGSVTCKLLPVIQMCFPDAISLILCLIALERYMSIIHPFRPNPFLRQPVAFTLIATIWFIPLALNTVLAFTHGTQEINGIIVCGFVSVDNSPSDEEEYYYDDNVESLPLKTMVTTMTSYQTSKVAEFLTREVIQSYKVWQSAIVLLFIPGILFPFCYGQIIVKVFSMNTTVARSSKLSVALQNNPQLSQVAAATSKRLARAEKRRRNVTLLSIVLQVVHFTCWTPIVVFQMVHFFRSYPTLSTREYILLRFFILLASANPALNSLLYAAALYREAKDAGRPSIDGGRLSRLQNTPSNSIRSTNPKRDEAIITGGATVNIFARVVNVAFLRRMLRPKWRESNGTRKHQPESSRPIDEQVEDANANITLLPDNINEGDNDKEPDVVKKCEDNLEDSTIVSKGCVRVESQTERSEAASDKITERTLENVESVILV